MTLKPKSLGLVMFAMMALAIPASTASAEFHSEAAHTILSGSQPAEVNDVFTFNAGTVTCTSATYSGTSTTTTSSGIEVTPAYSGCTAFGFVNALVDINGCRYHFRWALPPWHLICPPGQSVTVTAFNCHVRIGSQTIEAPSITYTHGGSGTTTDLTFHGNVPGLTGIVYSQESKSFPGCTNGTFKNGAYKGAGTITGADTVGNHVAIRGT